MCNIADQNMCCLHCGHIGREGEPYELEYPDREDDSYPICPQCGEWNTGGYSSYAKWEYWQEDDQQIILELQ